jgi:PAS domain S-box-containing protein
MSASLTSPLRILLIEDNPNDARLVRRHLKKSDSALLPAAVEFYHAESLDEGVALATDHTLDLLLLDLGLPESEGPNTYVRAHDQLPQLPIVVLTNLDDDQAAVDLLNQGAQDYLNKQSLNQKNLIRAVRYAIERWERQLELEQYERIVETMDDAALIVNRDLNVVYADNLALNQADLTTEQIDGRPAKEIAERSFATQAAVERYETALTELFQADGQTETRRLEVPIGSVGDDRVLEYQLCPLNRGGEMMAVIVVARDITERRQRLRELRQKTRAIEAAPLGIVLTDPNQEDNPAVYVNDAYQEMSGYSANELLGRNLRYSQGPETAEEPVAELREAIDERLPTTVELRNYRKDGEMFWNRVTVAPVRDNDGELLNFVGFQQDVTEKKRRQEKLETKTEKLEVLSRILRHDIKNDIQLIQGKGQGLLPKLSEPQRDELQQVLQTADHINELTKSSKALIEAVTEAELDTELTRLDTVIQSEIDSASSRFPDADISVSKTLSPTAVMANETLSSVIRNLLNNAVQHNRGEVAVEVHIEEYEDEVRVSVADNGSGVPDEQKREIFGKGEHGLESEGTGIGLYLVNQLVQSYGGEVWVADNDPTGAIFIVALSPVG